MSIAVREIDSQQCSFELRVIPGASRCQIIREDTRWKVKIDAPPVDGAANERLIRFLAKEVFKLPQAAVKIIRGETGRSKVVSVMASANWVQNQLEISALC